MKTYLRTKCLSGAVSISASLTMVFAARAALADADLVFVSDFYDKTGALVDGNDAYEVSQLVQSMIGDPGFAVTDVLATEVNNRSGTLSQYNNYINPVWSPFKNITHAVPGNHDYQAYGVTGFKGYFGSATYHSFTRTVGSTTWKIIGIDSNKPTDSAQLSWLDTQLSGQTCTIVFGHHPRWSSGNHGSNSNMDTIWRKLAANNVELYISGHDHDFERFWPKDANGNWSYGTNGVVQVVAGVGGAARTTANTTIVDGSIQIFATNTTPASQPGVLVIHLYESGAFYLGMYYSTAGELLHYWWNSCY